MVLAALLGAASSYASRSPTPTESSEITRALLTKFKNFSGLRVPRKGISVSSVDPNYARAHVAPGKTYQPFYAVLAKRRGSWAIVDYGADQVGCDSVLSKRVRLDLALGCPKDRLSPTPPSNATAAAFMSPSGNLFCQIGTSSVYCQSVKLPYSVRMNLDGRLKICGGARCVSDADSNTPALGYGRQISIGRLRCRSEQAGITCTVNRSGKSFLISRDGVQRVGP